MNANQRVLEHVLGAGVLGLMIGLFIGWVLWPVDWTEAKLDELAPPLRAQYISAVADAYLAFGGQDPTTALSRLQDFDNPQQAVADAIAFYSRANGTSESIQETNLRMLAAALAPATDLQVAPAPAAPAARDGIAWSYAPSVGWVNWILLILAAIVLLTGGIFIAYRLLRRPEEAAADETAGRTADLLSLPQASSHPDEREQSWTTQPVEGWSTEPVFPARSAFEDNNPLDKTEQQDTQPTAVDWVSSEKVFETNTEETRWQAATDTAQYPLENEGVHSENDNAWIGEQQFEPNDPRTKEGFFQTVGGSLTSILQPAENTHTVGEVVGVFEANYAFGIPSYDESFTITSADNEPLGACGMGINESLMHSAANEDQIRLLDVWLYDRAAVHSLSQTLVTPGFDTTNLAARTNNAGPLPSPPLEVAEGLTFTLHAEQIMLECTIKEVTFLEIDPVHPPFRTLKTKLVVCRYP